MSRSVRSHRYAHAPGRTPSRAAGWSWFIVIGSVAVTAFVVMALYLALRGRALGIPAIVIGAADESFSRQAEQLGAVYLAADDLDADRLQSVMSSAMLRQSPTVEEPVQWYYGLVVRPISVEASVTLPDLRAAGPTGRGVVVH